MVWISGIGWDLWNLQQQKQRGELEEPIQEVVDNAIAEQLSEWQKIFDYFTDTTRFPDGATFMLVTMYSVTDQCPDSRKPLSSYSPQSMEDEYWLQYANDKLVVTLAKERTDTIAVDVYPDILGHGINYDVSTCPYYSSSNEIWFIDDKHLNTEGYRHVAAQFKRAADRIYAKNCR